MAPLSIAADGSPFLGISFWRSATISAHATDDAGATTTSTSVAIICIPPLLPAALAGLTARVITRTSNDLRWTDRSTNETGFKIERSNNGKASAEIARVSANATKFIDGGISPGTKYSYRVRAFNSGGDFGYSSIAKIVK